MIKEIKCLMNLLSIILAIVWFSSFISITFAQETIKLQNQYLSITLDAKNGALQAIKNEKTGADYVAANGSGYFPFIVDASTGLPVKLVIRYIFEVVLVL